MRALEDSFTLHLWASKTRDVDSKARNKTIEPIIAQSQYKSALCLHAEMITFSVTSGSFT